MFSSWLHLTSWWFPPFCEAWSWVGIRGSPLVEGLGSLLPEHGKGTVTCAAVLAQGRVHISRLDHIDGGGDDRGAETRPKGGSEVAREVICHRAAGKAVSSPQPTLTRDCSRKEL